MTQEFKNFKEYIAYLEGLEATEVSRDSVVLALGTLTTRRAATGERRGQLAGLTVEDMDDEQLKREIINANSVHYKAVQRGASAETVNANAVRLEAAKAERDKRKPVVVAVEEEAVSEEVEAEL